MKVESTHCACEDDTKREDDLCMAVKTRLVTVRVVTHIICGRNHCRIEQSECLV